MHDILRSHGLCFSLSRALRLQQLVKQHEISCQETQRGTAFLARDRLRLPNRRHVPEVREGNACEHEQNKQ